MHALIRKKIIIIITWILKEVHKKLWVFKKLHRKETTHAHVTAAVLGYNGRKPLLAQKINLAITIILMVYEKSICDKGREKKHSKY